MTQSSEVPGADESMKGDAVAPARVVWITNLAAPYRLPVWRELATLCDLHVDILETNARLARDEGANRGADWAIGQTGLSMAEVQTWRVSRAQDRYYITRDGSALHRVASSDAVVLGGWDALSYWQALAIARARGVATVGFYESILATQKNSTGALARARALFFRSLDQVVVPGPAAQEAVLAMGVAPGRITVGFNAIDTQTFAGVRLNAVAHAGHHFLYVGQLIARKRVDAILRAFADVAGPEDRLTIVGRGELDESLHALAGELGVADKVDWIPYVPNAQVPSIMAGADTLVLASDEEVWGLVVNEALAAGMQVAVTRNCGVVPSVDGMRGVFIADTPDDMGSAMRRAKQDFDGRILEPEILEHTPEKFAHTFWQGIQVARARRA